MHSVRYHYGGDCEGVRPCGDGFSFRFSNVVGREACGLRKVWDAKERKERKKAGTGSENPYMGSHRPVPAVCLVVAGCSNYSEYRLFSLSENVLSRSFLRWAISSPMVRGGLVLVPSGAVELRDIGGHFVVVHRDFPGRPPHGVQGFPHARTFLTLVFHDVDHVDHASSGSAVTGEGQPSGIKDTGDGTGRTVHQFRGLPGGNHPVTSERRRERVWNNIGASRCIARLNMIDAVSRNSPQTCEVAQSRRNYNIAHYGSSLRLLFYLLYYMLFCSMDVSSRQSPSAR